jgi:DNA-binding response OmpR family regulator
MAVEVHYPRAAASPRAAARGLAVWVVPQEGTSPELLARAARLVLERALQSAAEAEVHFPAAGAPTPAVEEVADDGGTRLPSSSVPAAANPPVSLAGRRSIVAVDLASDTVLLDGVPVSFTGMEYSLLRYLVENQSRPVQREELQRVLESLDCPGAAFRSIDVYVGRVRRKLGSARHAIATVRGGGYQFVPGPGSTVRGPAEYCI